MHTKISQGMLFTETNSRTAEHEILKPVSLPQPMLDGLREATARAGESGTAGEEVVIPKY